MLNTSIWFSLKCKFGRLGMKIAFSVLFFLENRSYFAAYSNAMKILQLFLVFLWINCDDTMWKSICIEIKIWKVFLFMFTYCCTCTEHVQHNCKQQQLFRTMLKVVWQTNVMIIQMMSHLNNLRNMWIYHAHGYSSLPLVITSLIYMGMLLISLLN